MAFDLSVLNLVIPSIRDPFLYLFIRPTCQIGQSSRGAACFCSSVRPEYRMGSYCLDQNLNMDLGIRIGCKQAAPMELDSK